MSPPPRGTHPILAPSARSSPPAAWPPRPPLLRDRRRRSQTRLVLAERPDSDGAPQAAAAMKAEAGDSSMINLSVQQVLSLWAHGTSLRHLTEMWYWVFLWALFSSLFVHSAAGVLMFVMLQRHRQGRIISVIVVSIGFLGSVTGAMITRPVRQRCSTRCLVEAAMVKSSRAPSLPSCIFHIHTPFWSTRSGAAVAGIYRVAGKSMAPLEALVFGVGQTVLTLIISFSRILATL